MSAARSDDEAPSWDDPTLDPTVAHAGRLIDDGRYAEAETKAEVLAVRWPASAAAIAAVAKILGVARDDRAADITSAAHVAIEEAASLPPLLRTLARQLGWWDRHAEAIAAYRRLAASWPGAYKECLDERPEAGRHLAAAWTLERLLTDPLPDHWAAQWAKRALIETEGLEAAGARLGRLTSSGPVSEPRRLPLTDLDAYGRAHGIWHRDLARTEPVARVAPMVWREGRAGTGAPVVPRRFSISVLADAQVASKSSVIVCGGHALVDIQPGELPASHQDMTLDPRILEADDATALVLVTPEDAVPMHLDEAFAMVGVHSHAFGHWMFEHLMRLWAFMGLPETAGVPILVDERMPPQHRESLAILTGDRHPVVELAPGGVAAIGRLWTGPMPLYIAMAPRAGWHSDKDAGFDPVAMAAHVRTARAAVTAAGCDPAVGVERVFLARDDTQHRRIVNRPAVEALLAARGYRIFDFGRLTFRQQLEIMLGARSILVASGSSSTLTLFAAEGAAIGITIHEEEHADGFDWHASVGAELGMELLLLRNEVTDPDPRYRKHSSYRVDLDRLAEFLDDLEAAAIGLS